MNLVPHGILLQVTVWLINFQHGFRLCSGGEPGYLDFDNLPETNFSCLGKVIGGYYADVETGCQMFHVCTIGQKDEIMDIKFLCLNGTVFDQETRVCERVDEVDCSKSERFYNLNLELYGNNAVTLSLQEVPDDEGEPTESIDDQHSTTLRPTTSTTTTTTQRPTNPPATPTTTVYHQQNTGYSPHYQNQPLYSTPQTSQSKSLYDDKNSGYHHQYIFHNGEQANNQATSFQLFSNQGVSSTTNQPQIHQARYGTTSSPQIILNGPSTVEPLYHGVSSTIQTLLNNNGNNPSYINPLFHNHGIPSTTEHFTVHSSNPRETQEYHEDGEQFEDRGRRPLEAVQSTNQGKVSKLSISPIPTESIDDEDDSDDSAEEPTPSSHSAKISTSFLPTPTTPEPTARSFYPTPRTSPKPDPGPTQIVRHIHLSASSPIPQLKPQQITINLPPPDIQRIVQNPSPLLPSQSRVIVTAKASVSDESGRPLNTSELVVLPLPTIPTSYDDYKEGDESFDPFYRDVPKIRRSRSAPSVRKLPEEANGFRTMNHRRQAVRRMKRAVLEDQTDYEDDEEAVNADYEYPASDDSLEDGGAGSVFTDSEETMDIATIKANFKKFKALLLGRRVSGDISSERKTSKEHFNGVKSKSAYDGIDGVGDGGVDEDGSVDPHREMKMMMQTEAEDVENTSDQNSNGDENSGDTNPGDSLDSELMRTTNTSEVAEADDVGPAMVAKETEVKEQSDAGSLSDSHETDDEPDLSTVESDVKESHESGAVANEKESVNRTVVEIRDSENTANGNAMESSRDAKSLSAEEEAKSRRTSNEESAANTRESDAEEYIELGTVPNTEQSDVLEYVGSEYTTTTEETDVAKSIAPEMNAKESDSKEYVRAESSNTEELDVPEAVSDSETSTHVPNAQESPGYEISKESAAKDHGENTAELIPSDEAVAEITLETELTGEDERSISEQKTTTESTAGKVEYESEAKMDENQQEANQESTDTSNNEDGSVKLGMTLDVGELREKEISEPKAEKTDVEEADEPKPSMEAQESKADENVRFESIDLKAGENPGKSNADVRSEDSDIKEHDEAQPGRPAVISEVLQEAEESVIPDDLNLRRSIADQKPEVKEKLADHAMGKKPDSLVEKVESVAERKDSTVEEKSEMSIKPEEERESKLPQLDSEKSKPTIASGWRPSRARVSISRFPKTENKGPVNNYACTESLSPSPLKKIEPKTKVEADSVSRLSKFLSRNRAGDIKDKAKLLGVRERAKSLIESTPEEEYSNDAQLPQSKVKGQENDAGRKESSSNSEPDNSSVHKTADDAFPERSSASSNKIPLDLLDCSDSLEKHRKSSYENYRDEYDDYASEEYISESRESKPDERRSAEIGSQEMTSEDTDSGYTSGEDYVSVSGEPYSMEDSKPTMSSEDYSTAGYDSGGEYTTSGEDDVPISGEPYSTEDSRPTMSYEDYSTEGVLKFTDEIPEPMRKQMKQKNRAATRAKVSSEDYVDDNYEPEHYKENSGEKNQTLVEYGDGKEDKVGHESSGEGKLNDEAVDDIATTTTTSTTTTTTTTTTTPRPTPPSLFRPFSVRKNYKYIPPTTTPNPVVIKHRFGLLNPRPAKPIKSYSELAPKPVIRKSPLSLRKPYGAERTTEKLTMPQRRIDDFEDSSEAIWTSTEFMDDDEELRDGKLTRSANDVPFNGTNESSGNNKTDVSLVSKETLSTDSKTQNNDTSLDLSSGTENVLGINSAYLSTPYPLLKATTSGSLVLEETGDGKFSDTKAAAADEPTKETPNVTKVEGSSGFSASSSSTTEGPVVDSLADKKPLKIDRDHQEAKKASKVPFSCIDKEPYRFYGDPRDCRLFHYCSPGFTAKQMLDFRFVCEDTTTFDEETQSCRYDLENLKCANRQW